LARSLSRPRLLELLAYQGKRNLLLSAPSGYGKSVLAAQLASQCTQIRWLDVCGAALESTMVCSALVDVAGEAMGLASAGDMGVEQLWSELQKMSDTASRTLLDGHCLVIDDVALAETFPEPVLAILRWVTDCGCLVIFTTQDEVHGFDYAARFVTLGTSELCLTADEARAFAVLVDKSECDMRGGDEIWSACGGHPGLFALCLDAGVRSGALNHVGPPRRDGLDRWLERALCRLENVSLRTVFSLMIQIGNGDSVLLSELLLRDVGLEIVRLNSQFPFIRARAISGPCAGKRITFEISDVFRAKLLPLVDAACSQEACELRERVVNHLVDNQDYRHAWRLASAHAAPDELMSFLETYGECLLIEDVCAEIAEQLHGYRLTEVMKRPKILLLWAQALRETGHFEEALAKARAVHVLAVHSRDQIVLLRAQAVVVNTLRLLNRWAEAAEIAVTMHANPDTGGVPAAGEAMLAAGKLLISTGRYSEATRVLQEIDLGGHQDSLVALEVRLLKAMLPALAEGDFANSCQMLGLCSSRHRGGPQVDACRGNLAAGLLEIGRLARCSSLLKEVLRSESEVNLIHYLPVLGSLQFATGQESEGLKSVKEGIAKALERSAEAEAAQNRVFESMLLRAAGRKEDSLTSAERAYERLCVQDFFHFRRLAELEIAASLLSLGDSTAARAWAEAATGDGFGENQHHEYRSVMVLALCDLQEGDREAAVRRLAVQAKHLRTGNSNFQAAMYIRAFPQLLGLMAEGSRVASIPTHLLAMVPDKLAETALRDCQSHLIADEWTTLGGRLLGEEPFQSFVDRRGKPMCRVRMFGGLEVSVGDRTITDRDWKKRKARMLFAMLVSRQGNEIAREQVFDSLWPDLPADRAKNNFYVAWSAMKTAIMGESGTSGACPYVDNSGGRCRINTSSILSDIDEFESRVLSARAAETAGDFATMVNELEKVALMYHGDLMAGDPYEDWIAPLRDRYRREFVDAMVSLSQVLLTLDDPCRAIIYIRRAIEIDPREDLFQIALRCHIAAGQRNAAVEAFVNCKAQLADELGLDPSNETMTLYQRILVMEDRPRIDDYGLW
jgi:DNA-binding SARP family transcriptional activator